VNITGIMVVRNGITGGYPFLESVRAALPICDVFLIADGGSGDGTWEALEELRDREGGRVQLHRSPWPEGIDRRHVIAAETNRLKARCRTRYCFNVQANEIVHERTLPDIARQPLLHPEGELFRLPFLTVIGTSIAWQIDFRRRLFVNRCEIVSRGDGFDCGYDPRLLARSPRKLLRYVLHRQGEHPVHLSAPVFRFRALFPVNYLNKLRLRATSGGASDAWLRELAWAEQAWRESDPAREHPDAFWSRMRPFFTDCLPDLAETPAIIAPLLGRWEYSVALSLAGLRNAGVSPAGPAASSPPPPS
jgi:hypothetical protein